MVVQASAQLLRKVRKGPDFLIIGAQRAGTTWLHRVLRQHPSLWLAPVKELHYFDKLDIDPHLPRSEGKAAARLAPAVVARSVGGSFLARQAATMRGMRASFTRPRRKGLIAGEITPAYAILGEDVFRRIKSMNGEVKLIFIMRDPLDRSWSAVNNALRKGQFDGAFTVDKAVARARSSGTDARSTYTETIQTLEAVFPPSQLHYCFFDDLRDRPETACDRDRFVSRRRRLVR